MARAVASGEPGLVGRHLDAGLPGGGRRDVELRHGPPRGSAGHKLHLDDHGGRRFGGVIFCWAKICGGKKLDEHDMMEHDDGVVMRRFFFQEMKGLKNILATIL